MMTEQEVKDIMKPYCEEFGASLVMRTGSGSGSTTAYNYVYVDELGANVIINPNDGSFRFDAIVDWLFKLTSNDMSPITNHKHFDGSYRRFRKNLALFKAVGGNI